MKKSAVLVVLLLGMATVACAETAPVLPRLLEPIAPPPEVSTIKVTKEELLFIFEAARTPPWIIFLASFLGVLAALVGLNLQDWVLYALNRRRAIHERYAKNAE